MTRSTARPSSRRRKRSTTGHSKGRPPIVARSRNSRPRRGGRGARRRSRRTAGAPRRGRASSARGAGRASRRGRGAPRARQATAPPSSGGSPRRTRRRSPWRCVRSCPETTTVEPKEEGRGAHFPSAAVSASGGPGTPRVRRGRSAGVRRAGSAGLPARARDCVVDAPVLDARAQASLMPKRPVSGQRAAVGSSEVGGSGALASMKRAAMKATVRPTVSTVRQGLSSKRQACR